MTEIAKRRTLSVSQQGALVVLCIGGAEPVSMEFPLALQIATAMSVEARVAKRLAGDRSRRYGAFGSLHDASAPAPKRKRWAAKLPELLKQRDASVKIVGREVVVTIKGKGFGFGYENAITIARWIRVRAKEARNYVGEKKHWSDLIDLDAIEAREPIASLKN